MCKSNETKIEKYLCLDCFHDGKILPGDLHECSKCGSTDLMLDDPSIEKELEASETIEGEILSTEFLNMDEYNEFGDYDLFD